MDELVNTWDHCLTRFYTGMGVGGNPGRQCEWTTSFPVRNAHGLPGLFVYRSSIFED